MRLPEIRGLAPQRKDQARAEEHGHHSRFPLVTIDEEVHMVICTQGLSMATVLLRRAKSLIWQAHTSPPDKQHPPRPKDLENQQAGVDRTSNTTVDKSEFRFQAARPSRRIHKSYPPTTHRHESERETRSSQCSSEKQRPARKGSRQHHISRRSRNNIPPTYSDQLDQPDRAVTYVSEQSDLPTVHILAAYHTQKSTTSAYPAITALANFDRQKSAIEARDFESVPEDGSSTPRRTQGKLKMASEGVTPPIPYERMKNIATEACDSALSDVTKYTHASTETWNTTIINTILAALVKETTASSNSNSASTSAQQPPFKYVVNSTIIQHAPVSIKEYDSSNSGSARASGRRGMHSASGAYWNNEKDGMWSFKYEAAEGKGLDVVVGIIWIWVG